MALQFTVRSCWSCKFGLLVERQITEQVEDLDTTKSVLFCLLHPLDDITRVVMKQSNRISEFQGQVLIFTSREPSLAVTYCSETESHTVWRVRRVTQAEADKTLYLEFP